LVDIYSYKWAPKVYSALVKTWQTQLSEEYLGPQTTQRAAGFFYTADLGWESDLKSKQMKKYFKVPYSKSGLRGYATNVFKIHLIDRYLSTASVAEPEP
jgi:hypothetical protein